MAINFVKNDDIRILRDIEQYYSTQIDEMPMNGTARFHGNNDGSAPIGCFHVNALSGFLCSG